MTLKSKNKLGFNERYLKKPIIKDGDDPREQMLGRWLFH